VGDTPTRSLHRKLAQIMYEAERIPKNGVAPQVMGGYRFVQVGDAADYIRKALGEHLLTMMPTAIRIVGQVDRPTKAGGMMTTVDLVTTWTITDGESGESIMIESFGAGADGGDKYSGKASTSAMKYALLTAFLLSTGDDTELGSHEASSRPVRPAAAHAASEPPTSSDGSLIGAVAVNNAWLEDLAMRETPEGPVIGFRLKQGRTHQKVQAHGPMAVAVGGLGAELIGQTVTCWGSLVDEEFTPKGTTRKVEYQVLRLERFHGAGVDIPAPEGPTAETGSGSLTEAEQAELAGLEF
jgi:hypothetical protein